MFAMKENEVNRCVNSKDIMHIIFYYYINLSSIVAYPEHRRK